MPPKKVGGLAILKGYMSPPSHLYKILEKAQTQQRLSEFLRQPSEFESVAGYLLGESPQCVVIRQLNWDSFSWNGKCIFWKKTIRKVRCYEHLDWPMIALSESGLAEAVSPEYCQVDESEFLRRQLRVGTFLNIEQEADYPGEMLLCELIALKNNRLMVNSYDITLLKLEEIEIPFESITKITFDDGYSRAARRALRKLSKQKIGSSSCRITSKKLLPGGGKKKRKGVNQ